MNQKKNSGITWNCDCDCYALTDFDWEDVIERHPKSIIFVDENFSSMRSEKFASIVNSADNYFVLITRDIFQCWHTVLKKYIVCMYQENMLR